MEKSKIVLLILASFLVGSFATAIVIQDTPKVYTEEDFTMKNCINAFVQRDFLIQRVQNLEETWIPKKECGSRTGAEHPHSPPKAPNKAGDLNGDEVVDNADLLILESNFGRTDCVAEDWCSGADMTQDGTVDSMDYLALKQAFE